MAEIDTKAYESAYNDDGFWDTLKKFASKIGRELVGQALILFYVLKSSDTPVTAKMTILGALGYFISPVDLIPDAVPVVGFLDDGGVIWAALNAVDRHVTPEIRAKASAKLTEFFN